MPTGRDVIDRVLRNHKASQERLRDARVFISRLTRAEREALLAEMVAAMQAEDASPPAVVGVAANELEAPTPLVPFDRAMVAKAEAFVLGSPRGATAVAVGDHIGHRGRVAEDLLREIAKTRRSIVLVRGKWYAADGVPQRVMTLPVAIRTALEGSKGMGVAEVYERVCELLPNARKGSVAAELTRMVEADALVSIRRNEEGTRFLYALPKEGGAAAAR